MKAATVTAPGHLEVMEVDDPSPGPGQVVVQVALCGVCGTDLHVLDGDHGKAKYPVVPGHELSGTVVATGAGVGRSLMGQAVAVDPMVFCGHCEQCRAGWSNLCPLGGGLGTTADGAFAEYVAVSASQCEPVPPDLPPRWAPLAEPLSCCLHSVDRIGSVLGRRALVLGAGPAGLLLARLLTLNGAGVDVVERDAARRATALRFGAGQWAGTLDELEPGRMWDVVADATGNPAVTEEGLGRVAPAGTFALFGVPAASATATFRPYDMFAREITIVGSNSVRHTFGRALHLMAGGSLDLDLLISPALPLDRAASALDQVRRGQGLKVTIAPGATSGQA